MSANATEAPSSDLSRSSLLRKTTLWVLAILIMGAAIVYQRTTGPTYPLRGTYADDNNNSQKYKLVRSEWSSEDARVALPAPSEEYQAEVHYKRYKTKDEFKNVSMKIENTEGKQQLAGYLPKQPAAGKLEYFVTLKTPEGKSYRIPEEGKDNIVIRFKDNVPPYILWPHIIMMFFSILIGMRAGLGAAFAPDSMRLYVWISLIAMTIGGMTLGPIVQKYAFGEYWTGFPWGGDWTDNKMLVMWISWLIAASAIGFKPKKKEGPGRIVVFIAAVVMTAVYTIPHSIHGSELDYSKVDQGIDPAEAIKTGKP